MFDWPLECTHTYEFGVHNSSSSDGTIQLTPFTDLSLEQCIDFIEDDELLEVTPQNLRLRKRYLDPNQRKRANK